MDQECLSQASSRRSFLTVRIPLFCYQKQKNIPYKEMFFFWLATSFANNVAGEEGFGHEYFPLRRTENLSTPTRGFAYSQNIAPSSSSLQKPSSWLLLPRNKTKLKYTPSRGVYFSLIAGEEGFGPPITGPEPVALPLGYSPK